ncbi:hypothetical protein Ais01nite_44350 [Asanoa ishikariensis]|uniref:DUF3459 domain-containing protein n=1 Tax=Asanoa ishikariensis TaxID=137265 RepID=UPI000B87164D|nr:DUF3459 domain-containing protein [Asanoa ishikariensis]GIF66400.1 hypothetical protein Ais01nite_44350 [Asanoa ishikariensis]
MSGRVVYALDDLSAVTALADLGVDTVEIEPPEDDDLLRRFVVAARARGLGVTLRLASDRILGPAVVDHVVQWLAGFALDGVRLDGPPAPVPLGEFAAAVGALSDHLGRPLTLAESNRFLVPAEGGVLGTLDGVSAWLWRTEDPDPVLPLAPPPPGAVATLTGLRDVAATLLLTAPLTPLLSRSDDLPAATLRELTALRRAHPDLAAARPEPTRPIRRGAEVITMRRGALVVAANIGMAPARVGLHGVPKSVLFTTTPGVSITYTSVDLPPESAAVIACCRFDQP